MALRQERLAEEIRDLLAVCFQGGQLSDPRLEGVTITAVKLSPDLQVATLYYRTYSDDQKEKAQRGLESAAGMLRNKLSKALDVRRVPTLRFFYDESLERAAKIEKLLQQI